MILNKNNVFIYLKNMSLYFNKIIYDCFLI